MIINSQVMKLKPSKYPRENYLISYKPSIRAITSQISIFEKVCNSQLKEYNCLAPKQSLSTLYYNFSKSLAITKNPNSVEEARVKRLYPMSRNGLIASNSQVGFKGISVIPRKKTNNGKSFEYNKRYFKRNLCINKEESEIEKQTRPILNNELNINNKLLETDNKRFYMQAKTKNWENSKSNIKRRRQTERSFELYKKPNKTHMSRNVSSRKNLDKNVNLSKTIENRRSINDIEEFISKRNVLLYI